MRFAVLGSGSKGNALLVESAGARLLIDCGFSARETEKRLGRLDVSPDEIDAVLVSHEHTDHHAGAFRLGGRFGIPIYMTRGTWRALADKAVPGDIRLIDSHAAFKIEDMDVQPFPIPHDAQEPVQFVVSDARHRLGVLTDAGMVTPHIETLLKACDAIVLECNHDLDMLGASDYPAMLKRRIAGRYGHLSNEQAAALLAGLEKRLQRVVAAHLSEQNNQPELALLALTAALGGHDPQIGVSVACQREGTPWQDLL